MKKNLGMINLTFVMILLLIYIFVTYLFIDSDIEFVHFIIISAAFAIMVIAYNTGVLTGLIVSAVSVFGLGTYLFYFDHMNGSDSMRSTFFWILIFPAAALLAGYFGAGIMKMSEKASFLESELVRLISKDETTGFDNLREFYSELDEEISSARRHGHELVLMVVEAARFRDILAIYGKARTDEFIKLISQLITNTVRAEDKKYRIYDDMFAIVMRNTGAAGAEKLRERIINSFDALNLSFSEKDRKSKFDIRISIVQYDANIRSSVDFRDIAIEDLGK